MLGGGARGTHHFTEMVGGIIHVTINWSTVQEILEANPPVVPRVEDPVDPSVIDELCQKLPDFRKAYSDEGLAPEEFQDFGPLQHFRGMFMKGWDILLQTIQERRQEALVTQAVAQQRSKS